jgi:hypothetical protein
MSRLRIAIVAPPWVPVPPPAYGGREAVIDELARGLVKAGHEVCLFTTGDSTCPVPISWVYKCAGDWPMGSAAIELRHVIHVYEHLHGSSVRSVTTRSCGCCQERLRW